MFIFAFAMGFLISCFSDVSGIVFCCCKRTQKDKETDE
jgi:hypothetical protein